MNQQEPALRVLFVVPYVPNLIRVRPYNLLRGLHGRGNEVTLLAVYGDAAELAEARALQAYCAEVIPIHVSRLRSLWNSLLALPGKTPLQAVYSWREAGGVALERALAGGRFDVTHVEHLRGSRYALRAQERRPVAVPVVWDSVDSISYLFRQASRQSSSLAGRAITRLELGRTERAEGRLSGQFARVLVTSEKDKAALLALRERFDGAGEGPARPDAEHIQVLPNGVDLAYFTPGDEAARQDDCLVISGKMSYHANVAMVLYLVNEVMPLVWAERPAVKLVVAGKEPPREVAALAGQANITVTGEVADMRPYLQQATIAVAPLQYGAGIQNKVLEAMACATPAITTSQVAGSFSVEWGRQLLVADGAPAFAAATLQLLGDAARRRELGLAGRRYVEEHHGWDRIAARLEGIYRQAIAAQRGRAES